MSYFISSIEPVGLIFMPPVSKVTPLPTSAYGLAPPAPLYSSTISLGGVAEPDETASNAPMPSFSMSARSSTSTVMPAWVCSTSAGR